MNDNPLLNKVIVFSAKEEKLQGGKPVTKIKDEKGLTYTVYKTKQDGATSVAWEQLGKLEIGSSVQIGYVEDTGEYEGKPVTYRTIRSFNSDIGSGMVNAQAQGKTSNTEANRGTRNESGDAFGRRLAIHGMVNGMLAAGLDPVQIDDRVITHLLDLENRIDRMLNEPVAKQEMRAKFGTPLSEPQANDAELPTIQQEDDLSVSDIPF